MDTGTTELFPVHLRWHKRITDPGQAESSESSIDVARKDYEQKQQEYDAVVAEANARQRILSKACEV